MNEPYEHPKIKRDKDGTLWLGFGEYGESVEVACFSSDGRRLLTVQEVGIAKIWDAQNGSQVGEIVPTSPLEGTKEGPTTAPFQVFIEAAALSPDGSLALLGLNDMTAGVFEVSSGKRLSTLHVEEHQPRWGVLRAVNYSPDGSLAIVGFFGRSIGIWDSTGQNLIARLQAQENERLFKKQFVRDTMASSVAISQDNCFAFAGNADGTACVWDLKTQKTVTEAYEHIENIIELYSGKEALLWGTTAGNIWRMEQGQSPQKILAVGENWEELVFSPEGTHFLARGSDDQITYQSLDGEPQVLIETKSKRNFYSPKNSLGFGKNKSVYFHPDTSECLHLALEEEKSKLERDKPITGVVLSEQNDFIVTYGWNDYAELYEFPRGEKKWFVERDGGIGAVALSQNGLIAVGAIGNGGGLYPRDIDIWDIAQRKKIYTLEGHNWQIGILEFGPKGDWLVSVGRSIRLWELGREFTCTQILDCEDLVRLVVLSDERIVIWSESKVAIWQKLDTCILEFNVPYVYGSKWLVDEKKNVCFIAVRSKAYCFCLATGHELGIYAPEHIAPESPLSSEICKELEAMASGSVWKLSGGPYLHTGDGPRGWVTPLRICEGRYIVIPGREKAGVIDIKEQPKLVCCFSFSGKLRDSYILPDKILAVNAEGRVFSHSRDF